MSLFRSIILTILIFSVLIFWSNSHTIFSNNSFQIPIFKEIVSESLFTTINNFFDLNMNDKLSKSFWWLFSLSILKYGSVRDDC